MFRHYDPIDDALPLDEAECEATQDVAHYHGYDLSVTPIDKLFAYDAMGFDMEGAMYGD